VYVTGGSNGTSSGEDYATVAYDAASGAQLWASRYNGPGNGADQARDVAVSPDGKTVFVTGASNGGGSGPDYATVAYDAATGTELWASRYSGPGRRRDGAYSLAVSPDGTTVFVTGGSEGITSGSDFATVAYNAATGARRWVGRYNGPANRDDIASAVAVSPDGHSVFVTGTSTGGSSGLDYATVAYNAATGARRWVSRYTGPGDRRDMAAAVAVSPGGHSVFVTGTSTGAASGKDYATVAYNAATGSRLWARRYNGPKSGDDSASSVAVAPGGHTVYVTGGSVTTFGLDYATVAYAAATGARRWVSFYDNGGFADVATAVAVSPDGKTVYVTGRGSYSPKGTTIVTYEYATVAYDGATGSQRWVSRYQGPGHLDRASSLAVAPSGGAVYVTGESLGDISTNLDYATVGYHG
jgi:WD40 repeat protein